MATPSLASTLRPSSKGYRAGIDDLLVRLAVAPNRQLTISGAELEPPKVNTSSNPDEFAAEYGNRFVRNNFTGGEGLFQAHEANLPAGHESRFWASLGVDSGLRGDGELRDLRLLNATAEVDTSAESDLRMMWTGTRVVYCSGQTLRVSTDPLAGTPSFSADDPHDGESATDVSDVAFLGSTEYAALNANGIHQKTSGGAWSHWNDLSADRLWALKRRIVARGNSGRSLYEVTAAGAAPSALIDLAVGVEFTDVTDAGAAVLASASDGYIYAFTLDASDALELAAQTLIPGEEPTAVLATQGIVVFATRTVTEDGAIAREYRAELTASFTLDNRQTLRQWGDLTTTVDRRIDKLVASRDDVYAVMRDSDGDAEVWRFDLESGGMSRWWTFDVAGGVAGAVLVEGKFFAGVDAQGVYRQGSTYVTEGHLIGPFGDHFDAGSKNWVAGLLETLELPAGTKVEFFYSTEIDALNDPDSSSWFRVLSVTSGSASGETSLSSVYSRGVAGMVKLSSSAAGADTPKVRSFGFRSNPGEGDVLLDLAVDVGDQVERPGRRPYRVRGRGEALFSALEAKRGRSVTLTLFRPDRVYRGLVQNVAVPIPAITERGSVTSVCVVQFRGRAVSALGAEEGGALGFGIVGLEPVFGGIE